MTKMVAIVSLSLAIVVLTIVGMNVLASNKAIALEQQRSVENIQSQVAKERVENNHVATSLASTEVGEKIVTLFSLGMFQVSDYPSLYLPHHIFVYARVDWAGNSSGINAIAVDTKADYTEYYVTKESRGQWMEGTDMFNSKYSISQSNTVLSSDKQTITFSMRVIRLEDFASSSNEIRTSVCIRNSNGTSVLEENRITTDNNIVFK